MKKLFKTLILILLVVPFVSVKAMANTQTIVDSLTEAIKDANGTVNYNDNEIQISWPVWVGSNENIYEISYDGNIIEYDPEIPTNYDEASQVLSADYIVLSDILSGILKANGYNDTQIRTFLTGEYQPTFAVNGIEISEKGGELEFSSDSGSLKMTPLKIKIDVTKANINTSGEPEVKTTTIDDVVNALNDDESFTEYKYEGIVYSTKSIEMDEDNKKLIITYNENNYDWRYVDLGCEDGIITYEVDEINDFDEASNASSYLMFLEMIKNIALKANGYTMQQIMEYEKSNKYYYYSNGIEIKELGESKKYVSVDETESVTVSPVRVKINLSKANLKTKEELESYTVDSDTNSGDSISFSALDGDVYSLYVKNVKDMTDTELQQIVEEANDPECTIESLKEQLNKLIVYGNKAAGNVGTLLKLYQIELTNNGEEVHEVAGGFKIRIKITDDMKGYDSYKLVYIADDGTTEDAIELTQNKEYLEGILPHLSIYALVGSKAETASATINTNNPKTSDNIIFYISMLGISIISLIGLVIYNKKRIN